MKIRGEERKPSNNASVIIIYVTQAQCASRASFTCHVLEKSEHMRQGSGNLDSPADDCSLMLRSSLICALPHGLSSKRDTALSLLFISHSLKPSQTAGPQLKS